MSTLSERALLTTLSISTWTARRLDRSETTSVNRKHGLAIEAARVNKNLLPAAAELATLQSVVAMVRKSFDQHTLPWSVDGMRILKSDAYMSFSQDVRGWQDQWEQARDDFVRAYPALVSQARRSLGTMFDHSDYPDARDLQHRFKFAVRVRTDRRRAGLPHRGGRRGPASA